MHRFVPRRPTPALIIAIVAVVLALTGSAIAATVITGNQIKNGSIGLKDLSKKARKALKGQKGQRGARGAQGPTGTAGTPGVAGTPGAPGEAVGYAMITAAGTVEAPDRAKNVTSANVQRPATGTYCFVDLPFAPKSAVVTSDNGFGEGNTTLATVRVATPDGSALGGCPANASVRVQAVELSDNTLPYDPTNDPFVIWFEN